MDVLAAARVRAEGSHLVFRGADRFERGLSIEEAKDTVLVYDMNGVPLPAEHGFPLRAIVPGWYAVASVKWLAEIEVTGEPFAGYFQSQRYVFERETGSEPVRLQRVRSLIIAPPDLARAPAGRRLDVAGLAWSGAAPIARVEVRVGDGSWTEAHLSRSDRHAWVLWRLTTPVLSAGKLTLSSRATDQTGATQPLQAEWNRLGYGNNSIHTVTLEVW